MSDPEKRIVATLNDLRPLLISLRGAVRDKTLDVDPAQVDALVDLTVKLAEAVRERE